MNGAAIKIQFDKIETILVPNNFSDYPLKHTPMSVYAAINGDIVVFFATLANFEQHFASHFTTIPTYVGSLGDVTYDVLVQHGVDVEFFGNNTPLRGHASLPAVLCPDEVPGAARHSRYVMASMVPSLGVVDYFGVTPEHLPLSIDADLRQLYIWNDVDKYVAYVLTDEEAAVHGISVQGATTRARMASLELYLLPASGQAPQSLYIGFSNQSSRP